MNVGKLTCLIGNENRTKGIFESEYGDLIGE